MFNQQRVTHANQNSAGSFFGRGSNLASGGEKKNSSFFALKEKSGASYQIESNGSKNFNHQ